MVLKAVHCLNYYSIKVVKHGKTTISKQRYLCQNKDRSCRTFVGYYSYSAYDIKVNQKIADMAMNGNRIRDTAKVLGSAKEERIV